MDNQCPCPILNENDPKKGRNGKEILNVSNTFGKDKVVCRIFSSFLSSFITLGTCLLCNVSCTILSRMISLCDIYSHRKSTFVCCKVVAKFWQQICESGCFQINTIHNAEKWLWLFYGFVVYSMSHKIPPIMMNLC